ncbi:MAG: MATE family efflux transporter [Sphingomonadales bacterium]|nr:MATE family efflux transporter [Sphingomonadales bacterium]
MTEPGSQAPAMRGDLTQGPIFKTLLLFSIPMLVGNVIQTLNGSINAIWVGRLLGESALAATTNANGIMFLLFAGVFGLGNATTVRVGQHFGARDVGSARRTFGSGLGFTFAAAAVIGLLGTLAAPGLLRLLATPAGSQAQALAYLRITFATMPFGAVAMMLGMGMRGVGEARAPLHATVLTVVLDVVFNPLLIKGFGPIPAMGIAGSALSSGLANLAGIGLLVWSLYRRDIALRLRGRAELGFLIPRREELAYILSKGVPMSAQMLLVSSAQMVMIGLVNREGVDSTAAYGASMQLWNYLQMPAFAISMAVSAMVAQNIGAGNHTRVSQVTRAGMMGNVAMTGVLAALLLLFAQPLLALFLGGGSPAVPIALHMQYLITWSFVVMGASMIVGGTMRAYGVVVLPLIIQVIALYPVRLGFYFLAYPHMGSNALWWSFPVASVVSAALTALLYTRGGWKAKRTAAYPAA